MKSSISASADIEPPCSSTSRTRSPSAVPPGSRTTTGERSAIAARSSSTCVDLPAPSGPSKVMKRDKAPNATCLVDVRGGEDSKPPLRLLALAAGDQVALLHQPVLQSPHVSLLHRERLAPRSGRIPPGW